MCDVLLNATFNFMHDLIFTNSSSHEMKVTVEIPDIRYQKFVKYFAIN